MGVGGRKTAKPEAIIFLVCHIGRASDHEVITHVFNCDNDTKEIVKSVCVSTEK